MRNLIERCGPAGKLRSYWENAVQVVVERKDPECSVYEVNPETVGKKSRILDRNLLLPCIFLPISAASSIPPQRQHNRWQQRSVSIVTDSNETSTVNEEMSDVVTNLNRRNTGPNPYSHLENEIAPETEIAPENETSSVNGAPNGLLQHVSPAIGFEDDRDYCGQDDVDLIPQPEAHLMVEQPRARRLRRPPNRLTYHIRGQVEPTNLLHISVTTSPNTWWASQLMSSINTSFPYVYPPPMYGPPVINTPYPFINYKTPIPFTNHQQPVYGQSAMPYQANWNFNYYY